MPKAAQQSTRRPRATVPAHRLPFVAPLPPAERRDGRTWNFWHAPATGNDIADYAAGRRHADLLLYLLRDEGDHGLLGWAVRDMIRAGTFGPVEIAFLGRIARAARLGAFVAD